MNKKTNNLNKRKKINVKDFLKAINFEPHPGQKPIIDAYISGKREIVWVAGRRAGKSQTLGVIAAMESMLAGSKIWVGEHSICAEAVSRGIVERIEKKM